MIHAFGFGAEVGEVLGVDGRVKFNALGDGDVEGGEAFDFVRIVGDEAHRFNFEIVEDERGNVVLALVGLMTEREICLNRVVALILQIVSAQFVEQADAAPFLPQIDHHAASGFGDEAHGFLQLLTAITTVRTQHVAGKTFGMDARQNVVLFAHVAVNEREMFFVVTVAHVEGKIKFTLGVRQSRRDHMIYFEHEDYWRESK